MTDVDPSWLTTKHSEALLTPRQQQMYRSHRCQVLSWLLESGKNPVVDEGYAATTVKTRGKRLDTHE